LAVHRRTKLLSRSSACARWSIARPRISLQIPFTWNVTRIGTTPPSPSRDGAPLRCAGRKRTGAYPYRVPLCPPDRTPAPRPSPLVPEPPLEPAPPRRGRPTRRPHAAEQRLPAAPAVNPPLRRGIQQYCVRHRYRGRCSQCYRRIFESPPRSRHPQLNHRPS